MAGMLEAKKPDWISASAGGGIAVEDVTHCLVELAFLCLAAASSADFVLGEPEGG
jgi:hypothetical protein